MVDGMDEEALCEANELFDRQNFQGLVKILGVGIVHTFGYGSNGFSLQFAQFADVFLRCASIDWETVQKVGVDH